VADRLLQEARKQVESEDRRSRLKRTLRKTGRVLMVAGRVALVAAVAAHLGLADSAMHAKPALTVWDRILRRPYQP